MVDRRRFSVTKELRQFVLFSSDWIGWQVECSSALLTICFDSKRLQTGIVFEEVHCSVCMVNKFSTVIGEISKVDEDVGYNV